MTIGYEDYTRLSRSGGVLLYGSSAALVNNSFPLTTYVGNSAYTTIAFSGQASTDFVQISMAYFTDNTISQLVGFRRLVRTSGQFSITQYPNLSEWLQVSISTKSGNPFPMGFLGIYASDGYAPQVALASLDVPMLLINASVGATTTLNLTPQHVEPGNGRLSLRTTATTWAVNVGYYDFTSGGYIFIAGADHNNPGNTPANLAVPILDTPMQVSLVNSDAAAKTFSGSWCVES
jgi:hypothetical protein